MAGTSVLKLKVDDKEYNSSLKQAQQGLQHLGQALNNAGKSFTQVDKSVVDYVRSIGQMETQSKSARGRIGEMSNAFIELSLQYKNMSNEVKSSDVGKALAESMEQLKQRTIDAKNELENLNNELNNAKMPEAKEGGLFSGLGDRMSGALQVFGGNLMTKAAGMAAGFVSEIGDAVKQSAELARQGEGIRNAFERLNRPGLLDNLREATHGTVTNLELMKAAVKFNDFKLPVEELGTMLAFAQQKAKDTGQSVSYLVDSIVNGLGRKSKLILDNLGISAIELDEKMKETGDMTKAVGEIIREQMSKAGDYVETAADRATRADVDLKNSMEDLGRTLMPLTDAGQGLFNSWKVAALDLLNSAIKPLLQAFTQLGAIQKIQENVNGGGFMERITNNLRSANNKDFVYSQQLMEINKAINKARGNLQQAENGGMGGIEIYRNRLKALEGIRDQYIAAAKQIMSPPAESAVGAATATPKGGGSLKASPTYAADSIAAQSALVSELTKKFDESGEAVRNEVIPQLVAAEKLLKAMRDEASLLKANAEGKLLGGDAQTSGLGNVVGIQGVGEGLGKDFEKLPTSQIEDMTEALKQQRMAFNLAGQSATAFGAALQGIQDPAAKAAGTVVQAVASIALGFATASANANTAGTGWGWLAWLAAGASAMATTIATIHSLTGYAEGGIVKGNSYSGDNVPAMVGGAGGELVGLNAGEVVLTKAMQGSLARQLTSQGGGMQIVGELSGEKIVLVANRYFRRTGQGEIVTW